MEYSSICPLVHCSLAWFIVFNNISVISWSALLVEGTGVPGENH